METHGRIIEHLRVDTESQVGVTVAGASVSRLYDMTGYDQAMLTFSMGFGTTNSTLCTCASVVVSLVESSASTAAGTTLIGGKATIACGTTNNTAFALADGVQAILIQGCSDSGATAATTGDSFRFGYGTRVVTFTYSSEATMTDPTAGNLTATNAYFGSSIAASTADTGGTGLIDSIVTALKSEILCCGGPNIWRFSTPGTAHLKIEAVNATAPIFYSNTMATTRMIGMCAAAAVTIPVRADQLTATANKKLVGLRWTTTAQVIGVNVTCIRSGGRYMPGGFVGVQSS
jgi:hypothetical protein